jgi:hypothetical protein
MIEFTFDGTIKKLTAIADCVLSFVLVGAGGAPGGYDRYGPSTGISGDTLNGKVSLKKGDILYCAVASRGLPGVGGWYTQPGGVGGTSINGFSGGRGGNSGPGGASGSGGGGGGATVLWRNSPTPIIGSVSYGYTSVIHKSSYDASNFTMNYLTRPLSTSNGFFIRSNKALNANSAISGQREWWVVINGDVVYHSATYPPTDYLPYKFVDSIYDQNSVYSDDGYFINIYDIKERTKIADYSSGNIVAIAAGGGGGGGGGNYGPGYISANPIQEKVYTGSLLNNPFQSIIVPGTSGYYLSGNAYYDGGNEGDVERFNGTQVLVVIDGKVVGGGQPHTVSPRLSVPTAYMGEVYRLSAGGMSTSSDVVQCFSFRSTFDTDLVPKRAYAYSQNPPVITTYTGALNDPFHNVIAPGTSGYYIRRITETLFTAIYGYAVVINGTVIYQSVGGTAVSPERLGIATRGTFVGTSYNASINIDASPGIETVECYSFTTSSDGAYDTRGAAGQYHRGDGGGAGGGGGGYRGGSGGTAPGGDTGGQAGSNGGSYLSPEVIPVYDINIGQASSYGGNWDVNIYDNDTNGYAAFDSLQTDAFVYTKSTNGVQYTKVNTPAYYPKVPLENFSWEPVPVEDNSMPPSYYNG